MDTRFHRQRSLAIFLLLLLVFIGLIGPLSNLGFWASEFVLSRPIISRVCALLLVLMGALNAFRCLAWSERFNVRQALKTYVSTAFAMSGIYYLMHVFHSGCYSFPGDISKNPSILDFIYFSFVTVTTVGYGDIVPRHTFVRVLVLLQVLFGLYLIIRISQKTR